MKQLTISRRAMACEFSVIFPEGSAGAVDCGLAALDRIEALEQRLSVFQPDSELSVLNRSAVSGAVPVAPDLYQLLRLAAGLSRATGRAFDAASGSLLHAWGFQGGPRRVPSETERRAALDTAGSGHVGFDDAACTIRFDRPGVEWNLGAIGKGYALDRAAREVAAPRALLQGGQSSLRAKGAWEVDLLDPAIPSRRIARVHLRDRAMGTSGSDHQFFECGGRRWGHILDPRTGWPASRLASASVLAPTAAEADALSTAFFVMGAEAARAFCRRHPALGAVLVHSANGPGPRVQLLGAAGEVEVLV